MAQDTQIGLPFARLSGKNLQADFEGGTLSSDGGVLFLRGIEAQVASFAAWLGHSMTHVMRRYTDHSDEIVQELDRHLTQYTSPGIKPHEAVRGVW